MYDMLKEQSDLIKELNHLHRAKGEKKKEEEEKKGESKLPGLQLFGF